MSIDLQAPEVQDEINRAVAEAMKGAEKKKDELLSETKAAKDEARRVKAEMEKLSELGIDVDEYNRLKSEAEKKELDEAESKGEWEKLKHTLLENHKAEMEKTGEQAKYYKDLAHNNRRDRDVSDAIASEKGSSVLLSAAVVARTKTVEEDGVITTVGLNPDGSVMYAENGEPATVRDVVKHLKSIDEYQPAFSAEDIVGSGSRTSKGGPGTGANPFKKDTFNLTQQAVLLSENPALYQRFKTEAGA